MAKRGTDYLAEAKGVNTTWGHWHYCEDVFVLEYIDDCGHLQYAIDLDTFTDAGEVLEWMFTFARRG